MSLRNFVAALLALAVLFAPTIARAKETAMTASGHHEMRSMEAGHCKVPPTSTSHHKAAGDSCCISMCTAVAVAPDAPAVGAALPRSNSYFAGPTTWIGYLGEIATPPPRTA
jgi:hypothetical protein